MNENPLPRGEGKDSPLGGAWVRAVEENQLVITTSAQGNKSIVKICLPSRARQLKPFFLALIRLRRCRRSHLFPEGEGKSLQVIVQNLPQ